MNTTLQVDFNAADTALRLQGLDNDELDELPFGDIQMDLEGTVLRYNATESSYSGLPRDRVVGRHFFRDVAPCSNNRSVAQRYAHEALDATIAYTGGPGMLMMVHWT